MALQGSNPDQALGTGVGVVLGQGGTLLEMGGGGTLPHYHCFSIKENFGPI